MSLTSRQAAPSQNTNTTNTNQNNPQARTKGQAQVRTNLKKSKKKPSAKNAVDSRVAKVGLPVQELCCTNILLTNGPPFWGPAKFFFSTSAMPCGRSPGRH